MRAPRVEPQAAPGGWEVTPRGRGCQAQDEQCGDRPAMGGAGGQALGKRWTLWQGRPRSRCPSYRTLLRPVRVQGSLGTFFRESGCSQVAEAIASWSLAGQKLLSGPLTLPASDSSHLTRSGCWYPSRTPSVLMGLWVCSRPSAASLGLCYSKFSSGPPVPRAAPRPCPPPGGCSSLPRGPSCTVGDEGKDPGPGLCFGARAAGSKAQGDVTQVRAEPHPLPGSRFLDKFCGFSHLKRFGGSTETPWVAFWCYITIASLCQSRVSNAKSGVETPCRGGREPRWAARRCGPGVPHELRQHLINSTCQQGLARAQESVPIRHRRIRDVLLATGQGSGWRRVEAGLVVTPGAACVSMPE
nr:PREDICTED: uncharacterized protein LOC103563543 [Equus przewalskii]